jgi:sec-independent protein translocase protein TatA
MGFSGIGIWEILLILIVALIVLGPSKVPEIARKLGQAIRAIRKASAELTTAVTKELDVTQSTPSSSQPKEPKASEAPPSISRTGSPSQDDQSTKPGGASATK